MAEEIVGLCSTKWTVLTRLEATYDSVQGKAAKVGESESGWRN